MSVPAGSVRKPLGAGRVRTAVIGTGHLGKFHAKIHRENPRAELVALVDADLPRAQALAAELGCQAFARVEDLPSSVQAVSIAVPTVAHEAVAVPLLSRGVHCLVEKPLAANLGEADRMLAAAASGGALLSVGHVERFQPALRAVKARGFRPRFVECSRLAPFSGRSRDIGVVHDLMIHDLDLVLDLVGAPVRSVDAVGGSILTQHEDVASVRIVFENGARANITASRASLQPVRKLRMFSGEGYASLDFGKNYGLVITPGPEWESGRFDLRTMDAASIAQRQEWIATRVLALQELDLTGHERPLQAEIDSFLVAAQTGAEAEVTGEDGRAALELADRIVADIRAQGW